jgi:hypothetical protein
MKGPHKNSFETLRKYYLLLSHILYRNYVAQWIGCGKLRQSFVPNDRSQARSFSSASAPAAEEAGFWPVTSLPSVTTKLAQSAAFS